MAEVPAVVRFRRRVDVEEEERESHRAALKVVYDRRRSKAIANAKKLSAAASKIIARMQKEAEAAAELLKKAATDLLCVPGRCGCGQCGEAERNLIRSMEKDSADALHGVGFLQLYASDVDDMVFFIEDDEHQ